jgi:hypothetical protein
VYLYILNYQRIMLHLHPFYYIDHFTQIIWIDHLEVCIFFILYSYILLTGDCLTCVFDMLWLVGWLVG